MGGEDKKLRVLFIGEALAIIAFLDEFFEVLVKGKGKKRFIWIFIFFQSTFFICEFAWHFFKVSMGIFMVLQTKFLFLFVVNVCEQRSTERPMGAFSMQIPGLWLCFEFFIYVLFNVVKGSLVVISFLGHQQLPGGGVSVYFWVVGQVFGEEEVYLLTHHIIN